MKGSEERKQDAREAPVVRSEREVVVVVVEDGEVLDRLAPDPCVQREPSISGAAQSLTEQVKEDAQ